MAVVGLLCRVASLGVPFLLAGGAACEYFWWVGVIVMMMASPSGVCSRMNVGNLVSVCIVSDGVGIHSV